MQSHEVSIRYGHVHRSTLYERLSIQSTRDQDQPTFVSVQSYMYACTYMYTIDSLQHFVKITSNITLQNAFYPLYSS